jgi:hypothetical protein
LLDEKEAYNGYKPGDLPILIVVWNLPEEGADIEDQFKIVFLKIIWVPSFSCFIINYLKSVT